MQRVMVAMITKGMQLCMDMKDQAALKSPGYGCGHRDLA